MFVQCGRFGNHRPEIEHLGSCPYRGKAFLFECNERRQCSSSFLVSTKCALSWLADIINLVDKA